MLLISSIWVKINKLYRLKSELFSYIVLFTIFTWKVWAEEVGNIDRGRNFFSRRVPTESLSSLVG